LVGNKLISKADENDEDKILIELEEEEEKKEGDCPPIINHGSQS